MELKVRWAVHTLTLGGLKYVLWLIRALKTSKFPGSKE